MQDAFLKGDVKVLVATSAFGLGVNKPNIRWVWLRQQRMHVSDAQSLTEFHPAQLLSHKHSSIMALLQYAVTLHGLITPR